MQPSLSRALLGLPRRWKRIIVFASDSVICAWSAWAAIYLRLGEWTWLHGNQWIAVVAAVLLAIPIFERAGLYRTIFRHTGWPAMISMVRACLAFAFVYSIIFTFIGIMDVPRTVGLIEPVLLFVSLGASRVIAHYLLGGSLRRISPDEDARRVLIYGAGESGRQLAAALRRSSGTELVGFLDDDKSLQSGVLEGVKVYGSDNAARLISSLEVAEVLLACPSASVRRRREIVELLGDCGVSIRTLPSLVELARGEIHVSDIRPLEIEDLLGREPVQPDAALLAKNVVGKTVMVTGGGGSIGSELSRQIFAFAPARLVVVETSEHALYQIHRELSVKMELGDVAEIEIVPLLASVHDETRMRRIFDCFRPDTIYHAAAYKHVPLVEFNCLEGLKNNAFGTFTVARLAAEYGARNFVLISTDKAVRPPNVMGAAKRLAELIVQALASQENGTRFSIVRFGNVLGSSGSVVPLFRAQIAAGGPITITHPDVTRYFMTIPEASQLVLQASAMATGGDVFVLDMGESVLIRDLAVNMVKLSGLTVKDENRPDGDIEIRTTGLRPGEKLYEELLIGENVFPTEHERIKRAREHMIPLDRLLPQVSRLEAAICDSDLDRALSILKGLVPEYVPLADNVDLVQTAAGFLGADRQRAVSA